MTSFYIHYPYCKAKCPYCDFNSHVRDNIDYVNLEHAYRREIEFFASKVKDKKITTIFFGGGTPSLMPINLVAKILENIAKNFNISADCEISLEANPTSSEAQKFYDLKKLGINRLSLGIQALRADDLKFLGREHSADEALKTIAMARNIFDNFSFDLIYARPQQTITEWQIELRQALDFKPRHLSLYQLTIEKGTKFFSQFQRQEFVMPDEELASEFYQITNQIMAQEGFEHYEISNYAHKNFQCRHNLAYWQSDDYIGVGAGAHSRVYFNDCQYRQAIQMIAEPASWMSSAIANQCGIQNRFDVLPQQLLEEIVIMGLRLSAGIDIKIFEKHLGQNFANDFYKIFNQKKLDFLLQNGFLKIDDNHLFIPQEKRILTNSILKKLV